MDTDENSLLLNIDGEEAPFTQTTSGSYGTDPKNTGQPVSVTNNPDTNGSQNGETASKSKHPWWKRERLQKNPSLDKVDEDLEQEKKEEKKTEKKRSSKDGLFGVRSYLHHFYEAGHAEKDPNIYENEDDAYLLGHPRRQRCTSIWWKVFVWIGANFLIFGLIGVLVGYLVPQKAPFVGKIPDHIYIVDHSALAFNFNLDVCKLVGLILFCIGGLTLAVALLFPSFLYHYFEDDRKDGSFKIHYGDDKPPTSPIEMQIPASSLIAGVQPDRKDKESIVTKEGMVPYKD